MAIKARLRLLRQIGFVNAVAACAGHTLFPSVSLVGPLVPHCESRRLLMTFQALLVLFVSGAFRLLAEHDDGLFRAPGSDVLIGGAMAALAICLAATSAPALGVARFSEILNDIFMTTEALPAKLRRCVGS